MTICSRGINSSYVDSSIWYSSKRGPCPRSRAARLIVVFRYCPGRFWQLSASALGMGVGDHSSFHFIFFSWHFPQCMTCNKRISMLGTWGSILPRVQCIQFSCYLYRTKYLSSYQLYTNFNKERSIYASQGTRTYCFCEICFSSFSYHSSGLNQNLDPDPNITALRAV